MKTIIPCLAAITIPSILVEGTVYFSEEFNDGWQDRWVVSKAKEDMGEFEWSSGSWHADEVVNKGLLAKDKARFYGISAKLDKPFSNEGKDLVLQYTVKNEDKGSSFCGGEYIKLLPSDVDQEKFGGDSEYKVMFGPDLCGYDVSRVHTIFNYKGENLLKEQDIKLEGADKDAYTKLYTLHLRPDNTYTVYVNQEERASGNIGSDWAKIPSPEIDDPTDKKPESWVDEEEIKDPEHVKPEGYDDIPMEVVDTEATKPEDWDDEDDGEWEAPMIANPEYKGPWEQKMIPNPEYKGEWKPKQIPNPDFDKLAYKFDDIGAIGFELWIVDNGSVFDNIFVGDSLEEAKDFAKRTWGDLKEGEKKAKTEADKAKAEADKAKEEADKATEEAEKDDEDAEEEVPADDEKVEL